MAAKYGSPYVYSDCQRTLHWVGVLLESELTRLTLAGANIFRRNQTAIASEMDVRMLMR